MIKAKEKFREGYIMLKRPFQFAELNIILQKFTILWAYSEQPVITKHLSQKGKNKIEDINNTSSLGFFGDNSRLEWIDKETKKVFNNSDNYENLYEGEIIQCELEGQICRFYPDEYSIISQKKLNEIMSEEGYHVICDKGLYKIKEFKEKSDYLKSRGVPKKIAEKWASLSYGNLVLYKPYFELLKMFCKPYEIIIDDFYKKTEGIDFTEIEEQQLQSRKPHFVNQLQKK